MFSIFTTVQTKSCGNLLMFYFISSSQHSECNSKGKRKSRINMLHLLFLHLFSAGLKMKPP